MRQDFLRSTLTGVFQPQLAVAPTSTTTSAQGRRSLWNIFFLRNPPLPSHKGRKGCQTVCQRYVSVILTELSPLVKTYFYKNFGIGTDASEVTIDVCAKSLCRVCGSGIKPRVFNPWKRAFPTYHRHLWRRNRDYSAMNGANHCFAWLHGLKTVALLLSRYATKRFLHTRQSSITSYFSMFARWQYFFSSSTCRGKSPF